MSGRCRRTDDRLSIGPSNKVCLRLPFLGHRFGSYHFPFLLYVSRLRLRSSWHALLVSPCSRGNHFSSWISRLKFWHLEGRPCFSLSTAARGWNFNVTRLTVEKKNPVFSMSAHQGDVRFSPSQKGSGCFKLKIVQISNCIRNKSLYPCNVCLLLLVIFGKKVGINCSRRFASPSSLPKPLLGWVC